MSPQYTNVSPLGALDLPLIGRVVDAGETITVTDQQASRLVGQDANWQPADEAALALAKVDDDELEEAAELANESAPVIDTPAAEPAADYPAEPHFANTDTTPKAPAPAKPKGAIK